MLQRFKGSHSQEKIELRLIELAKLIAKVDSIRRIDGSVVVEIGTGWSPICAVLFYLLDAKRIHTFDHVRHVHLAEVDVLGRALTSKLPEIADLWSVPLESLDSKVSLLQGQSSLEAWLAAARISYFAPGDATKTNLPARSVDIVFSYAVLEHVSESVIEGLTLESKRILTPQGIAYHLIGLHDHYSFDRSISKVNFLQYSERFWAFFVKNSISFHNRLREKQFLSIFKKYGCNILEANNKVDPNDVELLKRMRIDPMFTGMSLEELAAYKTEIIFSFSAPTDASVSLARDT